MPSGSPGEGGAFQWLVAYAGYDEPDCLIWPFCRNSRVGRGHLGYNGRQYWAHRLMCELVNGPAPTPKHQASHTCGKGHTGCVHPGHLKWKTNSENQADRAKHGTAPTGKSCGFTESDIAENRALWASKNFTQMQIAEAFDCSLGTVQYYLKYQEQRGHTTRPPDWGTRGRRRSRSCHGSEG
jgi:hypothetical protein